MGTPCIGFAQGNDFTTFDIGDPDDVVDDRCAAPMIRQGRQVEDEVSIVVVRLEGFPRPKARSGPVGGKGQDPWLVGKRVIGAIGISRDRPDALATIGRPYRTVSSRLAESRRRPAVDIEVVNYYSNLVLADIKAVLAALVVDAHLNLELDLVSDTRNDAPLGDVDPKP